MMSAQRRRIPNPLSPFTFEQVPYVSVNDFLSDEKALRALNRTIRGEMYDGYMQSIAYDRRLIGPYQTEDELMQDAEAIQRTAAAARIPRMSSVRQTQPQPPPQPQQQTVDEGEIEEEDLTKLLKSLEELDKQYLQNFEEQTEWQKSYSTVQFLDGYAKLNTADDSATFNKEDAKIIDQAIVDWLIDYTKPEEEQLTDDENALASLLNAAVSKLAPDQNLTAAYNKSVEIDDLNSIDVRNFANQYTNLPIFETQYQGLVQSALGGDASAATQLQSVYSQLPTRQQINQYDNLLKSAPGEYLSALPRQYTTLPQSLRDALDERARVEALLAQQQQQGQTVEQFVQERLNDPDFFPNLSTLNSDFATFNETVENRDSTEIAFEKRYGQNAVVGDRNLQRFITEQRLEWTKLQNDGKGLQERLDNVGDLSKYKEFVDKFKKGTLSSQLGQFLRGKSEELLALSDLLEKEGNFRANVSTVNEAVNLLSNDEGANGLTALQKIRDQYTILKPSSSSMAAAFESDDEEESLNEGSDSQFSANAAHYFTRSSTRNPQIKFNF